MPTDAKGLKDKFSVVSSLYSEANQLLRINRDFYNLEFGDQIVPPQWASRLTPTIPPTAAQAVDEPASHILTTPHIFVPVRPTDDDEVGEELRTEIVRHAVNAIWAHVASTSNVIGDGRKPILSEGKIAIRKTLRMDLIPDYPKKGRKAQMRYISLLNDYRDEIKRLGQSEFLWDFELLDNTTVFQDPSDYRNPHYIYCSYQIFAEEAARRWPNAKGEWMKNSPLEKVTYTEYWSLGGPVRPDKTWEPGKFIQWVEDEVVHDAPNPYPYIPIVVDDGGFGVNYRGVPPEKLYVGISQKFHDMFLTQAENITSWRAVERLAAFPIGKTRNIPDDKEFNIGPGELINFEGDQGTPGSEDLEWMSHPDVPQGVVAIIQQIQNYANSVFKTETLGGIPQTGVDTATEADLNVRNANAILSTPIRALERVIDKLTAQCLMDVELVIRAPITLYGTNPGGDTPAHIVLKPTDINGMYRTHATLTTTDQEVLQQSKARFWLDASVRSRGLSTQTAFERGEIVDDPLAEFFRRASEDTFFDPTMMAARTQAAAANLKLALQPPVEQSGVGDNGALTGPVAEQNANPQVGVVPVAQQAAVEEAYANRNAAAGV